MCVLIIMFQPSCKMQRFNFSSLNFNLRRAKLGTGSLKLGGGMLPRLALAYQRQKLSLRLQDLLR